METNTNGICGLSNIYADNVILSKQGINNDVRNISYQGNLAVKDYALSQNYPNPFNPETRIDYQLKDGGHTRLAIYDMLGREVALLVNEEQQTGYYSVHWNAANLSSGMYVYRLTVRGSNGKVIFNQVKRMVLMK